MLTRNCGPVSLAGLIALFALSGCGGATALFFGLSEDDDGGGGSSTSPLPTGAVVNVQDTAILARRSPATLTFRLTNVNSEAGAIEILVRVGNGSLVPATLVAQGNDAQGNPIDTKISGLMTSPQGVVHTKQWDFDSQLGGGLHEDINIVVRTSSGSQQVLSGMLVGNDPPAVARSGGFADALLPGGEVLGVAKVTFQVSDSSRDTVRVIVDYALADGLDFDAGEFPADADFSEALSTTGPVEVQASPAGTAVDFFWDVFADLGATEHAVALRVHVEDLDEAGVVLDRVAPVLTRPFRVDNNLIPAAHFDTAGFAAGSDERGVIPVAIDLADPEADDLEVVVQWARPGQSFPALPLDPAALATLLADPDQRDLFQVATERPLRLEGHLQILDPARDPAGDKVLLPELNGPLSSPLRRMGLVGRELEILRGRRVPVSATISWSVQPFTRPVASLPLGEGLSVLVLDAAGGGSWALREVELDTGNVARTLVGAGNGGASTMAWETSDETLLVAASVGSTWEIHRIEIGTGTDTVVATVNIPLALRGLVSLGPNACLINLHNSLYLIDFPSGKRTALPIAPLQVPWGMIRHPAEPARILVAENGADRVAVVDLHTLQVTHLSLDPAELPAPQTLALDRSRSRLLVITDADVATDGLELRVAPLFGGPDFNANGYADSQVVEIATLPGANGSIAVGDAGMLLLALSGPSTADLFVGGGIAQVRQVVQMLADGTVTVDRPFNPALRAETPWQVRRPLSPARSLPLGRRDLFPWDAAKIPGGGDVLLRVTPVDTDLGTSISTAPTEIKRVRAALQEEAIFLSALASVVGELNDITIADVDLDGDLDLVTANRSAQGLAVFWQDAPGKFTTPPISIKAPEIAEPNSVSVADLDGNGFPDLVAADRFLDRLTVTFQTSQGQFNSVPRVVADAARMQTPVRVLAADLRPDGMVDLISINEGSDNTTIFFQETPGAFSTTATVLAHASLVHPTGLAVADMDQDADLDVIVVADGDGGPGSLVVFFQTLPGLFDTTNPLVLGSTLAPFHPVDVAAADVDGDGDVDLITANALENQCTAFLQIAPGSLFPVPLAIGNATLSPAPAKVRVGDLDGDGDADVITVNGDGSVTAFFQGRSGGLNASFNIPAVDLGGSVVDVEIEDLNGDGRIDLVAGNPSISGQNVISLLYQGGAQAFAAGAERVGDATLTPSPAAVAHGDLDGDGLLDLVTANANDSLTLLFQTQPRRFEALGPALTHASLVQPMALALADLNLDQGLDIVASTCPGAGPPQHVAFLKTSTGYQAVPWAANGCPSAVVVADIDRDGLPDVIAAHGPSSGNENNITIYFQTAGPRFDVRTRTLGGVTQTGDPRALLVTDFDRDGDLDIASANFGSDSLTVYLQGAGGVFPAIPLFLIDPALSGPVDLEAGDFNQDGGIDVVAVGATSRNLIVFLQGPNGGVVDRVVLDASALGTLRSVALTDQQGDGNLDLVVQGSAASGIFTQTALGLFARLRLLDGDPGIDLQGMVSVDLDFDQELDLVGVDPAQSEVGVHYGEN